MVYNHISIEFEGDVTVKFGISKEVITPVKPVKLACAGGDFDKDFLAIHDDVYVRCLVMDDGKSKVVFVAYDLLFHDRSLNVAVEKYAKDKYGIEPGALVISYSHAHTTPATRGYNSATYDEEYEEFLLERSKSCLDRALCVMFEGTVEHASFNADYNISRRGNRDGKFGNIPDYNYERDSKFNVLCIRDVSGKVRSVIMNYACHPVFYPARRTVCGEFPARLCQYIDMKYYGCTSLFFQSAGGDVRPRATVDDDKENGKFGWKLDLGFEGVDAFAKCISDGVSSLIECGAFDKVELSLAAEAFEIELPMEPAPLEYFKEKNEFYGDDALNPNAVNASIMVNGGYDRLPDSLMLHCQAIRLSDNLFVATMGGEPCFGAEKAVLSAFGDKKVMFIGYTDSCAYVVDDKVLSEGGYEPTCHIEYCLKGPFKAGLNKLYCEGFKAALRKISE